MLAMTVALSVGLVTGLVMGVALGETPRGIRWPTAIIVSSVIFAFGVDRFGALAGWWAW